MWRLSQLGTESIDGVGATIGSLSRSPPALLPVRALFGVMLASTTPSACLGRTSLWADNRAGDQMTDTTPGDAASVGDSGPVDCALLPHATLTCHDGDVHWQDACGTVTDFKERCGPGGCNAGVCTEEAWFAFGEAELAPWSVVVAWGSAAGGGISNTGGRDSTSPALVLDATAKPVVAWQEYGAISGSDIYVARWDGTNWEPHSPGSASGGGVSQTIGASSSPTIGLAANGTLMVAWSETTATSTEIYLRQWTGTSWDELGTSASGGGISADIAGSGSPKLVFAGTEEPVVAWAYSTNSPLSYHVYIRRWAGAAWTEMGAGSASGTGIDGPSGWGLGAGLVLLGTGNLLLAWLDTEPTAGNEIYARQWDGAAWGTIGAGSSSGGGVSQGACDVLVPAVAAVSSTGLPLVAWNVSSVGGTCTKTAGIHLTGWDGSTWAEVTDPLAVDTMPCGFPVTSFDSYTMAMERDRPVIVADDLRACMWDNGVWAEMGPGSATGILGARPNAQDPALAFDPTGSGFLAWSEAGEIRALQWSGTAWSSTSQPTGSGRGLSGAMASDYVGLGAIAVTDAGRPVVAWFDTYAVHLKAWDGSDWQELDGSATGDGIANTETAAYGLQLGWHSTTGPVVAWAGFNTVSVARFDGSTWVPVAAGAATTVAYTAQASNNTLGLGMALSSLGRPVIAWGDGDWSVHEIYVLAFDGAGWVEVGVGSASGVGISNTTTESAAPVVAMGANDRPVVAWQETLAAGQNEIFLRQFDGAAWLELANSAQGSGVSQGGGLATAPALAVGADNLPILAWSQNRGGNESDIYVRKWDGVAWQELGTGSAQAGGVSDNGGPSERPRLTIDPTNRPVLAWVDGATGNSEVLLRRFDGSSWQGLAGSASGSGISNSLTSGYMVDVAANGGVICVTWDEQAATAPAILSRCTRE